MRTLLRRVIGQRNVRIWVGIFLLATIWVWQRYAVVQTGDRIQQLRIRVADLIETRDALLAETTTLSSRNRIEALASAHLGLQPITDKQYRHLPLDSETTAREIDQAMIDMTEGLTTSQ
ncbi:MAG: hypothetical protein GF341_11095 [candidate division Zixibacteria bacterium]|nr:hypothetical protein [candidate division Zixibacteria bacterium]